jgi:alpha/beta superfamily hydrolase
MHGGTLHNKVVYRAAKALSAAGYDTLRFNFRGIGASEGAFDDGRGETDDVRAALDEAARRSGPPLVAGGFSFGSAAALRAIDGDERVVAFLGLGLPVATPFTLETKPPRVPALFVVGEQDRYGPPTLLARFVGDRGKIVVVPGADHFFAGHLDALEAAIADFLASLRVVSEAVEKA